MIGTGFSFNDGEQILVSVQKPLGIILEQDPTPSEMPTSSQGPITVVNMDLNGSAARAGVQVGDTLLAIQNMSVEFMDLDQVLDLIGGAPRVLNLRFLRRERGE
jgi:C-terminal processing protease CtpA/Prc